MEMEMRNTGNPDSRVKPGRLASSLVGLHVPRTSFPGGRLSPGAPWDVTTPILLARSRQESGPFKLWAAVKVASCGLVGTDGIRGVGTASHHRESRVADCALMSRLQGRQTLEYSVFYRVRNYSTVPREPTKSIEPRWLLGLVIHLHRLWSHKEYADVCGSWWKWKWQYECEWKWKWKWKDLIGWKWDGSDWFFFPTCRARLTGSECGLVS